MRSIGAVPPPRTPRPDGTQRRVTYYHLQLEILPQDHSVRGVVTVALRQGPKRADSLVLDAAPELTIDSAKVEGAAARFARDTAAVRIGLPQFPEPGAPSATVFYHGLPAKGLVFRVVDGAPVAASYGLPYSARHWWPCIDSPGTKADSVDVDVTVPDPLLAVSNGLLRGRAPAGPGLTTYRWSARYPIYPDVVSVAVADYASFTLPRAGGGADSGAMTFYVYRGDVAKAESAFAVLPGILAAYERTLGPYPFAREGYGVVEFPLASFREHQTRPSYGASLITTDHHNDWILAHELAHQWFGNSLTVASWSDAWLNEGFATYASALWRESTGGRDAYRAAMAAFRQGELQGALYVVDSTDVHDMFTDVTFQKGAWVLHMLRHVVGDRAFFAALRRYVAQHAYRTVRTADFQRAVEAASGRHLGWFFREWVYGAGLPRYAVSWRALPGSRLRVSIDQTQASPSAIEMPLDLLVSRPHGDTTITVPDRHRRQDFVLDHLASVTSVRLDPDAWVLSSE